MTTGTDKMLLTPVDAAAYIGEVLDRDPGPAPATLYFWMKNGRKSLGRVIKLPAKYGEDGVMRCTRFDLDEFIVEGHLATTLRIYPHRTKQNKHGKRHDEIPARPTATAPPLWTPRALKALIQFADANGITPGDCEDLFGEVGR